MEPSTTEQIQIVASTKSDVVPIRTSHGRIWRDTYENEEFGVTAAWLKERTEGWLTDEAIEKSYERHERVSTDPSQRELVAKINNVVVGFAHGSSIDGVQHLEAIYVDVPYHGKGVAKALMDELMDWFDVRAPITLEVVTYNDRAQAFYKKYGFREVEGSGKLFVGKIPIIEMKREGIS
ncbi:GNAT family N-acetyltransferase [Candidatus Saccharibacteria bacterium]|nr:GNAT family N-acetyltransferase [Candidatus Saccharibacteria bacterium]NCS82955.1 GNAT family N-acetyltransferase [Candidatus Saccharibacteria bacterium]